MKDLRILEELPLEGERVLRIGGADLCALLGISPAALTSLKKRGLASHLGHDAYDLRATVSAYVTHLRGIASGRGGEEMQLTLTGERARLAREQADAQALKNAQLRGELVAVEAVEREWQDILRRVRAGVMAVPSRVRQAVALTAEQAEAIDHELRAALQELGHDHG